MACLVSVSQIDKALSKGNQSPPNSVRYTLAFINSYPGSSFNTTISQEKNCDPKGDSRMCTQPPRRPASKSSYCSTSHSLQVDLRIVSLRYPADHRAPAFGELVRSCYTISLCPYFRTQPRFGSYGGRIWLSTCRCESSSEVWTLNAVHVSWVQWSETLGLGFGSTFEQDTEWRGDMGRSSMQHERLFWFGLILILSCVITGGPCTPRVLQACICM